MLLTNVWSISERIGELGPAVDVYAMGALLYTALTGRPPFVAETSLATLKKVIETEPLSPRDLNDAVPRDLETICLKCLEKTPSQRYAGLFISRGALAPRG